MDFQLYDSLSRSARPLAAADDKELRFYCCGPTVYGPAHIGNFRTFILQDVLRRSLEALGHKVRHVRNLTDVDDKTIRQSREEKRSLAEFTAHWTKRFHEDCAALNLLPPHVEPAATAHIPQQIDLIGKLIDKGHAYRANDGSVYFRVSSFSDYGKLSRLKDREILTGRPGSADDAAGPVDADEYELDSAADFALWKSRKPDDGEVFWPSPWGEGRPGWHIECSAMSMAYLGETFDLHGGGVDLVFPHHENEIAQSEACTCQPFARHWFHSAHLMVEGRKMSKSLGNLHTLDDIRARGVSPAALRYALLSGHYRQPLNFTWETIHSAESALEKLRKFRRQLADSAGDTTAPENGGWGSFSPVAAALADDLNTSAALGAVFRGIREVDATSPETAAAAIASLDRALGALGLALAEEKPSAAIPADITRLAEERWAAKQAKNFAEADRLRDQLKAQGWTTLDRKDGYDLEPLA